VTAAEYGNGDEVVITIDEVGTLHNPVRLGKASFAWPAARP
jgi:fumarylacetoacetate (FAA) hydrolase family protein